MKSSPPAGRAAAPDALTTYLRDIATRSPISPDAECALAARARDGDDAALDALVCANLRFVVATAKRYRWRGVALDDLISEGNLGLIRAAHRFDPTIGTRLTTFAAWWIRQAMVQAIADQAGAVRVPLEQRRAVRRAEHQAGRLTQQLGWEPTVAELAAAAGVSPARVLALRAVTREVLPLDTAPGRGAARRTLGALADPDTEDAAAALIRRDLAHDVARSMSALTAREALTLRLHFGLDGDAPMSLVEIGRHLGVTRERARQIKSKALEQLANGDIGARLAEHRA